MCQNQRQFWFSPLLKKKSFFLSLALSEHIFFCPVTKQTWLEFQACSRDWERQIVTQLFIVLTEILWCNAGKKEYVTGPANANGHVSTFVKCSAVRKVLNSLTKGMLRHKHKNQIKGGSNKHFPISSSQSSLILIFKKCPSKMRDDEN